MENDISFKRHSEMLPVNLQVVVFLSFRILVIYLLKGHLRILGYIKWKIKAFKFKPIKFKLVKTSLHSDDCVSSHNIFLTAKGSIDVASIL